MVRCGARRSEDPPATSGIAGHPIAEAHDTLLLESALEPGAKRQRPTTRAIAEHSPVRIDAEDRARRNSFVPCHEARLRNARHNSCMSHRSRPTNPRRHRGPSARPFDSRCRPVQCRQLTPADRAAGRHRPHTPDLALTAAILGSGVHDLTPVAPMVRAISALVNARQRSTVRPGPLSLRRRIDSLEPNRAFRAVHAQVGDHGQAMSAHDIPARRGCETD